VFHAVGDKLARGGRRNSTALSMWDVMRDVGGDLKASSARYNGSNGHHA